MKNWKSLFCDIILERGYDRYTQGLVKDYREDNGAIKAIYKCLQNPAQR